MITVHLGAPWRHFTAFVPAYGSVLGTVTRDGIDTGALVRVDATGLYVQVSAGALRALPQAETAAAIAAARGGKIGGAGRGQGRKPADGKRGERFNVTLDADSVEILRGYGGGELSRGIRLAATLVEREVGRREYLQETPATP